MYFLSFFLPLLLLQHNPVNFLNNGAADKYVNILNCAVTEYIEKIEHCNQIKLINKTGCMDEDGIWHLGLQFESYTYQDMNGARKMILQIIDSFLKDLNQNLRLKKWLLCFPFTTENIEVRINFVNDCLYSYPSPGQIKYVTYNDGMITYDIENPRLIGKLIRLRDETLIFAREAAKRY